MSDGKNLDAAIAATNAAEQIAAGQPLTVGTVIPLAQALGTAAGLTGAESPAVAAGLAVASVLVQRIQAGSLSGEQIDAMWKAVTADAADAGDVWDHAAAIKAAAPLGAVS